MNEYSILAGLMEHPRWIVGLIVLGLIILFIPYDIVNDSRRGIRVCQIHALLWTWEQRPGYSRLHLPGLRLLQRKLLDGLHAIWKLACDRFIAGITDMLRRWLG